MSAEEVKTMARLQNGSVTPFRRPERSERVTENTDPFDGIVMCPVTQRVILVSPYPRGIHELVSDLSDGCFDVLVFHHWEQGIRNAQAADLLVLDLTPFRDPGEVAHIHALIQETGDTPSLILVNEDLLPRLDHGLMNHELLVYPARSGEIVYRAQRIISTGSKRNSGSRLLTGSSPAIFKDLWIDRNKMAVYRNGSKINLTKTEYELLVKLLEREGGVLSREDLLTEVWGTSFMGGSNIVDVHIKSLRKKLGDRAVNSLYISTVRGVGYRLAD